MCTTYPQYGHHYGCGSTPNPCTPCPGSTPSCTTSNSVTMRAQVLEVFCDALLVCNLSTCQQVRVNTPDACCYQVGQCLCITYNGVMTTSLPPQISATSIQVL